MKKEYILQALSIFLSVFLAIMAGNWNEAIKEKRKTKAFLQNLVKEMQYNQKMIGKTITYHQKMRYVADSMFQHMSREQQKMSLLDFGGLQNIPQWRGLGVYPIDNSVYESGLVSGALNNIPMDLLSKIARMQSFQSEYTRFSRLLSEKLMGFDTDTKTVEVVIFISILGGDMLNLDREIVKAYGQITTEIEKYYSTR